MFVVCRTLPYISFCNRPFSGHDCGVFFRVVEMCKIFQETVREMSEKYFSRLRRHNYVTPTSYLELILTFKTLLQSKRDEVDTVKNRYIVGLQKLDFAASQV